MTFGLACVSMRQEASAWGSFGGFLSSVLRGGEAKVEEKKARSDSRSRGNFAVTRRHGRSVKEVEEVCMLTFSLSVNILQINDNS